MFLFQLLCTLIVLFASLMFTYIVIASRARGYYSSMLNNVQKLYKNMKYIPFVAKQNRERKAPDGLPFLSPCEVLSERVVRVSGLNPGPHTLQGTNTYLVGTGKDKLLVDTGEDVTSNEYVSFLLDTVFPQTSTSTISDIILTHGHGDHQGGVVRLLQEFGKRNLPLPVVHKREVPNGHFPCEGFTAKHVEDQQIFRTEGATLHVVYTSGHTDDHISLVVEEDKGLISGDCVLGCGTTVFDHLGDYMQSLFALQSLMARPTPSPPSPPPTPTPVSRQGVGRGKQRSGANNSKAMQGQIHVQVQVEEGEEERRYSLKQSKFYRKLEVIYPGHGPKVEDALAKISEYIHHRRVREKQIMSYLLKPPVSKMHKDGDLGEEDETDEEQRKRDMEEQAVRDGKLWVAHWHTSWEIVQGVYPPLSFVVKISAQQNVLLHLQKLLADGIVERNSPDFWRIKQK